MKMLFSALFMMVLSANAFANEGIAGSGSAETMACKNIKNACEAAGYVAGGASSGKGLWKQCVKPLLDNKSVSGVVVSPDDIKSCQNMMTKIKKQVPNS